MEDKVVDGVFRDSCQIQNLEPHKKGVLCQKPIKRGTLIIAEYPMVTIPTGTENPQFVKEIVAKKLRPLHKTQQHIFFGLYNNFPNLSAFEGIIKTNAIPMGLKASEGGIFPLCSRFNHSCNSNAAYCWLEKCGMEKVFALRDIEPGEEITVAYVGNSAWALPRAERRQHIKQKFGFECDCQTCVQNSEDAIQSDKRRDEIGRILQNVGDGFLIKNNPGQALGKCRRGLELLEEEAPWESQIRESIYYDAFQIAVLHGDLARARSFALLSAQTSRGWQGIDSEEADETTALARNPATHRLYGPKGKWKSKVTDCEDINSPRFQDWLWQNAVAM